jgi:hypothetical protein
VSDTELNRSLWDERALLHGQDGYYDVEGFRAGGSSLSDREIEEVRAAVGDVEGLDPRGRRDPRVHVPRGAELGLLFGSANRDPSSFAQPEELRLDRDPNPHLTFGAGLHFCLGAPLARLELQTSFATTLRRLPRLELAEEPRWKPGYIIRGLESLLVRA